MKLFRNWKEKDNAEVYLPKELRDQGYITFSEYKKQKGIAERTVYLHQQEGKVEIKILHVKCVKVL